MPDKGQMVGLITIIWQHASSYQHLEKEEEKLGTVLLPILERLLCKIKIRNDESTIHNENRTMTGTR